MTNSIELAGLDGGNPLGFLAALGTLRTMSAAWPQVDVRMSWRAEAHWLPILHAAAELNETIVIETLDRLLSAMHNHPALASFDNLEIPRADYQEYSRAAVEHAPADRTRCEFAAAFGCDCIVREKNGQKIIQDTALRTMSGAGHQDFVRFMRNIIQENKPEHLRKALFRPWCYDDPVRNLTLRWDPIDDSRYALRWDDPSKDSSRQSRGGVLGANRLAIEGLLMLPSVPIGSDLATTGFRESGRNIFWTWPIWTVAVSAEVVRSLLALRQLQCDCPPRSELAQMGIAEIYRSRRITTGKYRNLTPAEAI
jgi:hypothetical protein